MKKLSLMIACVGIVSIAAFGSGHRNVQMPQDGTKQKAQESPKAQQPKEAQKPVQVITATPVAEAEKTPPTDQRKEIKKGETKPGTKPGEKAHPVDKDAKQKQAVHSEKAQPVEKTDAEKK